MKTNILFLVLAASLVITGCDLVKGTTDENTSITDYLKTLQYIDQETPTEEPELVSDEGSEQDGSYSCSVKKIKASVEYSEMFCLDPQTDIIWPGSLLDGNTIANGKYTPISLKRGPLTISISLPFTDGSKSATVEEAKLSTVRNAIAELIDNEITGSTPAKLNFVTENVYESSQLNVAVGFNYESPTVNINAMFDFSNENIKQRVVAKFVQVYYSIDIDLPTSPTDLLDESVTTDDLKAVISGNVSPMYVSSVQYGRMALFTFESSSRSIDLKTAVDASYNNASGNLDIEYQNFLNNSTIKLMVLGGDGESAVQSIDGYEAYLDMIKSGGNFSKDSPAAPLAYKLRYLKDNSIGNIVLTSEYTVRNCEKTGETYVVSLKRIFGGTSQDDGFLDYDLEVFGWIDVTAFVSGDGSSYTSNTDSARIWNTDSGSPITIDENALVNISGERQFSFTKADASKSGFTVKTSLYDYDAASANDTLGENKSSTVYLSEVQSYQELSITGFSDGLGGVVFEINKLE